ncbi:conserved hypothetical protein [Leptospira biflexa serovar Patoc strain 'Patoc 1 (Ames)']|uniref:SnoaL-like domain-containing protein n=1 Tax=Leptospira biflexa serovar Patoc (strain Patoc 1 / ATCC 23582 / Paris) TaxID=456481 RepID=B0ST40_LEPBP|nr:steroid Delta-isomerase [Leptospira biflexa]ABZ94617.1 conserved hypothetical protein [Leptospira biflexa serovar Patoc strain 'Patoc 1 (Ames)']ABZ98280.1 Conserved hypothetical protein [Leptospira biflexa serovar Patoc strain 'Patoc 1 (Paris)']
MNKADRIEIIENQLIAYNNKDIEKFLTYWDQNAKIYLHPNTLIANGIQEIKERHLMRFQEPDLSAELISRKAYSEKIVDFEIVTRNLPEGKAILDVLAIYEIENNFITKAWFLIGEPIYI